MKRSEINAIIKDGEAYFARMGWRLPVWATWGVDEWKGRREDAAEIFQAQMGWDITDFGSGDYRRRGLFLFTLRNGVADSAGKPYAEKIMLVDAGQETPTHFHHAKMEDIINRGGADLVLQLWKSDENESLSSEAFDVSVDGIRRHVEAGGFIRLGPGESICLEQGVYHRFFGEGGRVLVGEVSKVNDDNSDNRFLENIGRFPAIVEDEGPWRLLVSDYRRFFGA